MTCTLGFQVLRYRMKGSIYSINAKIFCLMLVCNISGTSANLRVPDLRVPDFTEADAAGFVVLGPKWTFIPPRFMFGMLISPGTVIRTCDPDRPLVMTWNPSPMHIYGESVLTPDGTPSLAWQGCKLIATQPLNLLLYLFRLISPESWRDFVDEFMPKEYKLDPRTPHAIRSAIANPEILGCITLTFMANMCVMWRTMAEINLGCLGLKGITLAGINRNAPVSYKRQGVIYNAAVQYHRGNHKPWQDLLTQLTSDCKPQKYSQFTVSKRNPFAYEPKQIWRILNNQGTVVDCKLDLDTPSSSKAKPDRRPMNASFVVGSFTVVFDPGDYVIKGVEFLERALECMKLLHDDKGLVGSGVKALSNGTMFLTGVSMMPLMPLIRPIQRAVSRKVDEILQQTGVAMANEVGVILQDGIRED